jgi:hypothetical protein
MTEEYKEWSLYFFEKIKKYEIDNKLLSYNKNINENTINKNIEYKWNLKGLCENPSISYEYLKRIIKSERIDYTESELYYYKQNICKKSTYKIEDALNETDKDINISKLSLNNNIKWENIENNKDIEWDYGYLSRNKNLKIEHILENMNRKWDFGAIVRNPIYHISCKNKTLLRCKNEYFENPNFDLYEYKSIIPIKSYLDINRSIHRNKNINKKMIKDINILYPEFEFDYELLGDKKDFDFNYILSENRNWNIYYLSQNPNISFEIIDNGMYNWDYQIMSLNTFDKERDKYIKNSN